MDGTQAEASDWIDVEGVPQGLRDAIVRIVRAARLGLDVKLDAEISGTIEWEVE